MIVHGFISICILHLDLTCKSIVNPKTSSIRLIVERNGNLRKHFQNVALKLAKVRWLILVSYCFSSSAWRRRPSSVVRPLTRVSQKPLHGSRPNLVESYLSAISPDRFFFLFCFVFKIFYFKNFKDFFFVFVNMGPYVSQYFKTLLLQQFQSDFTQTL